MFLYGITHNFGWYYRDWNEFNNELKKVRYDIHQLAHRIFLVPFTNNKRKCNKNVNGRNVQITTDIKLLIKFKTLIDIKNYKTETTLVHSKNIPISP